MSALIAFGVIVGGAAIGIVLLHARPRGGGISGNGGSRGRRGADKK